MENNILNGENSENLNQENSSFFDEKVSSSNSNEESIPKIRFKQYLNNWKPILLSEKANYLNKKGKFCKKYYVSTENLLQNFEGLEPYTSEEIISGVSFQETDILLANIRPYLKKVWQASFSGCASSDVLVIKPQKINPYFLKYIIANETFINYVMSAAKGSKMPRGDKQHIMQFQFAIPEQKEQQKIADFLSLIDKRIEKQRLLVENLKKYKRGLFVQLYNQSTKNKIQIKNLGENFSAGILSKEDIVENGSNPCILYGELFTKYNEVIQEVYSSTNKNILSKTIGTEILFPSSTTVDALSLICPSSIKQKDIILGGDLFAIKLKKDFDNDFMSYLFNYIYKRLLAKFAQGITIVHLHYSDIKEQFIEVPSIQEQIKIIKIINNIENYILKNEKIYEQLKFIKQGLLQQMFI